MRAPSAGRFWSWFAEAPQRSPADEVPISRCELGLRLRALRGRLDLPITLIMSNNWVVGQFGKNRSRVRLSTYMA